MGMRGEAPRPSPSMLAGVVVAATEEATVGTWEGRAEFVVALRWRARRLGEFEAKVRPLEMSAGGGKEVAS